MTTTLITGDCWRRLSEAARKCRGPAYVAVAYVGRDGARQLPLRPGTRLVVDASDHAVKSSQTSPKELLRWYKNKVQVFNRAGLHAKVYVLGRSAFIGSANISKRSEGQLVEALAKTSEPAAVAKARSFVLSLCDNRLTETTLKRLAKLYVPPRSFPKQAQRRSVTSASRSDVPIVKLFQLIIAHDVTDDEVRWDKRQQSAARKSSRHLRGNDIECFTLTGFDNLRVGEKIVQCVAEPSGVRYVSPPGTIVRLRRHTRAGRPVTWVYLTIPPERRRRNVRRVARMLGRGGRRLLATNGTIRPYADGIRLLQVLER